LVYVLEASDVRGKGRRGYVSSKQVAEPRDRVFDLR